MTVRILSLILLSSLSPMVALFAADFSGSNRQIRSYGGGWVTGLDIHSSGRLYLRTDVGGAYKSTDGGTTWTWLSGSFTSHVGIMAQALAVRPLSSASASSDVLLMGVGDGDPNTAGEDGLWRSTNGGSAWTKVSSALNYAGNGEWRTVGPAIVWRSSSEAWTATRRTGVHRSTDSGATFTKVGGTVFDQLDLYVINAHAAWPNQIWVAGQQGVWVSTDNGGTWTRISPLDLAIKLVRRNDGTVFCAGRIGSGNDWRLFRITASDWSMPSTYALTDLTPALDAGGALDLAHQALSCLALTRNDQTLFAGTGFTIRRSSDGGGSWTTCAGQYSPLAPGSFAPPGSYVIDGKPRVGGGWDSVVQDPTNLNRFFVNGAWGVAKSGNLLSSTSEDTAVFYSCVGDRARSTTGNGGGIDETVVHRVRFAPGDPNLVLLPQLDEGANVVTDGGASGQSGTKTIRGVWGASGDWSHSTIDAVTDGSLIIAPSNATGFDGTGKLVRVFASTDRGVTWTKRSCLGLADRHLAAMGATPGDAHNWFVVCAGPVDDRGEGGVYWTSDSGWNFQRAQGLPSHGPDGVVNLVWNSNTLFMTAVRVDGQEAYVMLRGTGDNRGSGGTTLGLYRSLDGGRNWQRVPEQIPGHDWANVAYDRVTGRLWAFSYMGVFYSEPHQRGSGWRSVPEFTDTDWPYDGGASDLSAHGGILALIGRQGGASDERVHASQDGGTTWHTISRSGFQFPNAFEVAVDPHRQGQVWISTNGRSVSVFTPSHPTFNNAGNRWTVGTGTTRLQAEHYNLGGEGLGYHDQEAANLGGVFRWDGVDIEPCAQGGYNVGWTRPGEWLEYTLNISSAGTYALRLRGANGMGPSTVVAVWNGADKGSLVVPATGGWQNWTTTSDLSLGSLTVGTHKLRLRFIEGDANIDWFELQKR